MRVVVAGAGNFGFSVASLLAYEGYGVVVLEGDAARCQEVNNSVDCMVIECDISEASVYARPDVAEAEMFVACTGDDEKNLIAALLAKSAGVRQTVAIVRNENYNLQSARVLKDRCGVDFLLNPEEITAREISRILTASSSLEVDEFAGGQVKMFEARLPEGHVLVGKSLASGVLPDSVLAALILRRSRVLIPHGGDVFQSGDLVYFVGMADAISEFSGSFHEVYEKPRRVLMIGAGRTGQVVAPLLEKHGMAVKAIEKDQRRCEMLAGKLRNGMVLCGDGTDIDLLNEEGVDKADVVIAVTDDDKLNLMTALLTKHLGAKRTLVRVANDEYSTLMDKVGIDWVLSIQSLAAAEVLRLAHGQGVENVALLEAADSEALELTVGAGSPVNGKLLKDLALPEDALICAVVGRSGAVIPHGGTLLEEGDRVVLMTRAGNGPEIARYFGAGSEL